MYTIDSLKTLITTQLSELKKQSTTDKIAFELKLLNNIQEMLNTSNAQSIVHAFNCLQDGGDLPYVVAKGLLGLSNEACCGHFATLAALNFCAVKIDFLLFIRLMTQGNLTEKTRFLSTNNNDFVEWMPVYDKKPAISFDNDIINKEILIKKLMTEPDGLYLISGVNIEETIGHRFMIIKENSNFYYACNNKEGLYSSKTGKSSTMFPDLKNFTEVEGNYITPLNHSMKQRLTKRIAMLMPSADISYLYPKTKKAALKDQEKPVKKCKSCIIL